MKGRAPTKAETDSNPIICDMVSGVIYVFGEFTIEVRMLDPVDSLFPFDRINSKQQNV